MTTEKKVICTKLKQELAQLQYPPYPGELGNKIYTHISQQAWDMWLAIQTRLINEKRFNTLDLDDVSKLETYMYQYLFEDKDVEAPGYIPESDN